MDLYDLIHHKVFFEIKFNVFKYQVFFYQNVALPEFL